MIASRKSVKIDYIDSGISDHKLLLCSCEMLKPPPIYQQLQIRRWNFLDTEKFFVEVKLSPLSAATGLDVNSASDFYTFTLSGILDKMIPFKTVKVHEKPSDPWFDGECRTSKCLKRSLERIYMRTRSENDFAAWMGQKKLYKRLCRHKRRDYWNELSVIQNTKRLTFGATLIVSLVEKGKLLLKEYSLLNSNLLSRRKLIQQGTQSEPEKNLFVWLMHKKVVSVGSRVWMRMGYTRLFSGFPTVCV